MIKVLVSGYKGSMGQKVIAAVNSAEDMEVVAGVDITSAEGEMVKLSDGTEVAKGYADLDDALEESAPDVMVDFTHPAAVEGNIRKGIAHGVDCVVGTTGLSQETLEQLASEAPEGTTIFVAPNFTTGAVLLMEFSKLAAKYFPDCEIIEFHHNHKADSPSGTAIRTAKLIAAARDFECTSPGKETEIDGCEGARGALVDGVPIHSVRSDGFVAHQEVIFGSKGQTLTIRHDSGDRECYMPGVLLAVRKVGSRSGLIVGLESLMED